MTNARLSPRRSLAVAVCIACVVATTWACGAHMSSSPAGPGGRGVQMTATPDPVAPAGALTYTVMSSMGHVGPASSIVLHLPAGVSGISTSGAGWSCAQAQSGADAFIAAAHTNLSCSNALASMASPSLTVTVTAPPAPGSIAACVEMAKGPAGPASSCVDTTVR